MAIDISAQTRRVVYTGSAGVGPYAFAFNILVNTDIAVYFNTTELTLTTDYSVSISADGTGSVTLVVNPGGNIPATPDADDRVTLVGDRTIQRTTDFTTGGPLFATSLNDELDSLTIFTQQNLEQSNRSLRAPNTDPTTINMELPNNTTRANKTLAFDADGNPVIGELIGDWTGNWAAATVYNKRDLIKDTSNSNVYICIVAHTSSGAQPISTNTDVAKWALVVDAAAAGAAQAAAEAAQAAAETAETNAETAETNAETAQTAAETAETNAETAETNAATSETNAATSETNAATSETNAATSETNAATSETNAATSASNASTSASTATTQASNASTSASNASTSETNAGTSETNAGTSASNASTSASNASTSETNAATSANEAAASADAFDDVYLGSKSSDPTTDNDGDALAAGMLYYNTTSTIMRIYSGSAWENVAVSTSGFATIAGVETLTNKTLTSPKINEDVAVTSTATELNLLDGVSGLVQADFTKLAAIDATANEIDTLDGLSRGSIIYGNASAATAILTKGTAAQVLTSDGTDISWSDAASGGTDWQSSIKTSAFTAVAGEGYWINTSGGAFTITLPSSASVGDEIEFVDYLRSWGTNAVTININGLKFQSGTVNPIYDVNNQAVKIVYSGATNGWIPTSDEASDLEGLTIYDAEYLAVAGGGSGGSRNSGGGGAGGFLTNFGGTAISLQVGTTYTVTVGAGGSQPPTETVGNDGVNSVLSGAGITTITAIGGGGGGRGSTVGRDGGSGGGSGCFNISASGSGTADQGNDGGVGDGNRSPYAAGGGGGASAVGGNGTSGGGGAGGAGLANSITGSSVTRAGGGGGNAYNSGGAGGAGGGGAASTMTGDGNAATANTGGGGGGNRAAGDQGGAGGSGVVILRMLTTDYSGTTTGSPTVSTNSGDTILTFNSSGSYTG